jgi:hypothetical protein
MHCNVGDIEVSRWTGISRIQISHLDARRSVDDLVVTLDAGFGFVSAPSSMFSVAVITLQAYPIPSVIGYTCPLAMDASYGKKSDASNIGLLEVGYM